MKVNAKYHTNKRVFRNPRNHRYAYMSDRSPISWFKRYCNHVVRRNERDSIKHGIEPQEVNPIQKMYFD
jgi:hypothetical protein